jgi:hypothetical protein
MKRLPLESHFAPVCGNSTLTGWNHPSDHDECLVPIPSSERRPFRDSLGDPSNMDGIVCVVLWNASSEQRRISFPVSFVGNSGPVAFPQKPNK